MKKKADTTLTKNKKAFFDYEILESWEAGIELNGHEVKSIRAGQVNLKWSYISNISGEFYVKWMHISPWKALPNSESVFAERERKIFIKKKTMMHLTQKMKEKWHTSLPLSIYLKGSLIKIQIGLAKWKKQFQKKETIKDRDVKRDIQRAMSRNY